MNHSSTMSSAPRSAIFGASIIRSPPGFSVRQWSTSTRRWIGQMFDRVAGMHDVEAVGFQREPIFDARMNEFGAFKLGARIRHRVRRARPPPVQPAVLPQETRARSCRDWNRHPAPKAVLTNRRGGAMRFERCFGAEPFAVTHIAPIGAARNGRTLARRRGRCAAGSAPARNCGRDRPSFRGSNAPACRPASSEASLHKPHELLMEYAREGTGNHLWPGGVNNSLRIRVVSA